MRTLVLLLIVNTAACGQLIKAKELSPGYVPELYQTKTAIHKMIGSPETLYLPEFDGYEAALRKNTLTWLSTPVAESYRREYDGIPFTLDIFYESDNYRAGVIGPLRAVGFTLTSTAQVHYQDILPSVPWFKVMCKADCEKMDYASDGQRFWLVCPTYPHAADLQAALLLPRTRCLRVDISTNHPGFVAIHYAAFLPAAEELMADSPVKHSIVNMQDEREGRIP